MTALGYALLTEEHEALPLVHNAVRAEEAGFSFATVSDHFHPWTGTGSQGHSPFVWSVLGAVAQATDAMVLGTGVTCPIMRFHPVLAAQAAATMATLAPERFFFGVGAGEYLNEHVLGDVWPVTETRHEMLREAIHIIRELWRGEEWTFDGTFFAVDRAQIYSLPETLPPILVAASGEMAATLAAEEGDGLITTSPDAELVSGWKEHGGQGPRMGMLHLAYAKTEDEGRRILAKHWPHAPLPGHMNADLRTPAEFEAASKFIRLEDYDESTPVGPDPEPVLRQIREYADAGFDHVVLHQIGPEQKGFIDFFAKEIAPALELSPATLGS